MPAQRRPTATVVRVFTSGDAVRVVARAEHLASLGLYRRACCVLRDAYGLAMTATESKAVAELAGMFSADGRRNDPEV